MQIMFTVSYFRLYSPTCFFLFKKKKQCSKRLQISLATGFNAVYHSHLTIYSSQILS